LIFDFGSNSSLGSFFDSQESIDSSAVRDAIDKPFLLLVNAWSRKTAVAAADTPGAVVSATVTALAAAALAAVAAAAVAAATSDQGDLELA
jgi:hypothetical protein